MEMEDLLCSLANTILNIVYENKQLRMQNAELNKRVEFLNKTVDNSLKSSQETAANWINLLLSGDLVIKAGEKYNIK